MRNGPCWPTTPKHVIVELLLGGMALGALGAWAYLAYS